MKVLLLGTGGADGIPGLYSRSRIAKHARKHGGKDVRSRAAAVIDDVIKIDFGPDTWFQAVNNNLDAFDWSAVIFTHSDADHFAPDELMYSMYPFNEEFCTHFTLYGNEFICARIWEKYPEWPFDIVETTSFQPFNHAGYEIQPVRAHHKMDEDAQNLIISDGERTLFYATDTGLWDEPTWNYLADKPVDCLVLECTEGTSHTDYDGHLDCHEFLDVVARLRAIGTVKPYTRIVTTHHSHNGEATHDELCAFFTPKGVEVGYDGMLLEF